MWTDADALMRQGVRAGKEAYPGFLDATGWAPSEIHRTFCHQVGRSHRKLLFETLELDSAIDYPTVEFLGNTGAVALPVTAALGVETGFVKPRDHVALWGVGSGINVVALGVDWQVTLVDGHPDRALPAQRAAEGVRNPFRREDLACRRALVEGST
jgi:3-oxoacyl-[acyl-carrier-protein] synthase-3